MELGSCSIHIVHNAFGKGLEKFGKEIDQLCLDIHSLFKYSAARWEDFRKVQMELELVPANFQQHTEVRWLSLGPAISRILEQWDAITHFVTELSKDTKKIPKSSNFKRVYLLLGTKEKGSTKACLEFLNDVVPVFQQVLLIFEKNSPVVHILYDTLCESLLKPFRRFLNPSATEGKYGSDLVMIDCTDIKLQLKDNDLVIGSGTKKALKELSPDQQKHILLGVQSFYGTAASKLQNKLPLESTFLQQLGCLNPLKKSKKSTVDSIESLAGRLQSQLSSSEVVDEWKMFQVDIDLPQYCKEERIEKFLNKVFLVESPDGQARYKVLPSVIKSALGLGQTNAECERSLSINARVVTSDRPFLSNETIVGTSVVKEAVRFYDPVSNQVEKIIITEELKKQVRYSHALYKENQERKKEDERKKKEEEERRIQVSEETQREREKMVQRNESLKRSVDSLKEQEMKAISKVDAADEVKEATDKLDAALATPPISTSSVTAANLMLQAANKTREKAKEELESIKKKMTALDNKKTKLLDQALQSQDVMCQKRKADEEEKLAKKKK